MDHELLLARSITQAQHMVRALGGCGIRSALMRAPVGLTDRGCAYAVQMFKAWAASARDQREWNSLPMPLAVLSRMISVFCAIGTDDANPAMFFSGFL